MTRIALLPSAYLPDLGGVEELTHNLALTLRGLGNDVEVWTAKVPAVGPPIEESIDGIAVRRFPFVLPAMRPRSLAAFPVPALSTVQALRRAVRRFRPEILHVQCFGPNGVYATALAPLVGVPLIVTLQGETTNNAHDIFDHSILLRAALRTAVKRAAAVTGCSRFTLDDAVSRFGLPPDKGVVVFNGVSTAEPEGGADTAAERTKSRDGRRTVLAMGRMVQNKGFDLLIDGFARVAARHPDVDLVLGGDGEVRSDLEAQAARLELAPRVLFPGRLDRSQVARACRNADVFVLPSRVEPFGIVVLEAWRAGAAVVATTHGGPPEFVADGTTGLLVDPNDPAALARALDRLLSDDALRRRIGDAGQAEVVDFGWPTITAQYLEIYRCVVQGAP